MNFLDKVHDAISMPWGKRICKKSPSLILSFISKFFHFQNLIISSRVRIRSDFTTNPDSWLLNHFFKDPTGIIAQFDTVSKTSHSLGSNEARHIGKEIRQTFFMKKMIFCFSWNMPMIWKFIKVANTSWWVVDCDLNVEKWWWIYW